MKVALAQMQSGPYIHENMSTVSACIEDAAIRHKAELIVFPENFLCMGGMHYRQKTEEFAASLLAICDLAKHFSVCILAGSIPVPSQSSSTKCLSRSYLIQANGKICGYYDKVHLFDVKVGDQQGSYCESDSFSPGSSLITLPVMGRCLGLSICYDLRFPGLFQGLRDQGAEMIAVPSAFTYKTGQAHWATLLKARAIETQCFILAANQCGVHQLENGGQPRMTWGHSMIIDPWGELLCSMEEAPGICCADLDFERMQAIRHAMPLTDHRCY
jgi:nitrilase